MSTFLESISIIIAALSVIFGVTAWRSSFVGQKKIEIAEKILVLFSRTSNAIDVMRSPFSDIGEGGTRKVGENESPQETELLNRAYVVFERYKKYSDDFSDLFSMMPIFILYFGNEHEKLLDEPRRIRDEIFRSAQVLSVAWLRQGRVQMEPEERRVHLDAMHAAQEIFWEGAQNPDEIKIRTTKMIDEIYQVCRNEILVPFRWYDPRSWFSR